MADLLTKHQMTKIDFLKIDIEGSEFDLFSDSCPWLERVQTIVMEVHVAFGDPRALTAKLQANGFIIELRDNELRPVASLESSGYLFARRDAGLASTLVADNQRLHQKGEANVVNG